MKSTQEQCTSEMKKKFDYCATWNLGVRATYLLRKSLISFTIIYLCGGILSINRGYAQISLATETQYYINLIEKGEKLNNVYEIIANLNSITSLVKDVAYNAKNDQALKKPISGTVISAQANELINGLLTYVNNYDLPELESMNYLIPPSTGSKQSVSASLSGLTESVVFYHSKLKDFERTQKETRILLMKLEELRIANSRAERTLRDILTGGNMVLFNNDLSWDWFNFNMVFSENIGNAISTFRTRKSSWEQILTRRKIGFDNVKSFLLISLAEEKVKLQSDYDRFNSELNSYTQRVNELQDSIKLLEKAKARLQNIENDIIFYNQQIYLLNTNNDNYRSTISNLRTNQSYVRSEAYKSLYNSCRQSDCPYGKCPNNKPFDKCDHETEKQVFIQKQASEASIIENQISDNQISISNNEAKISQYQNMLSKLSLEKRQLLEQLMPLPALEARLVVLQTEKKDFVNRIDSFYALELMEINARNTQTLNNL